MSNYKFVKNPVTGRWVIIAPHRARRPEVQGGQFTASSSLRAECPFCEKSLFTGTQSVLLYPHHGDNWEVAVIQNKFPFAPIHEVIIHSQHHDKNFELLDQQHTRSVFKIYQERYNLHKDSGNVYIFQNRGRGAGESIGHPHSQVVVVPFEIPQTYSHALGDPDNLILSTTYFNLFSPSYSSWPYEITVAPKKRLGNFGQIDVKECDELADIIKELVIILSGVCKGEECSYNFYIYPGKDWYARILPREKIVGGFEMSSGIFVNDADPRDVMRFVKENFKLD